jgi:protein TonB
MRFLQPTTWILSLALHAGLLLAFIGVSGSGAALDQGSGGDLVVVEQGIAIEGLAKFGEAEEMIETVDIAAVQAAEPPKIVEETEPELHEVITATESPHEEDDVPEKPKPIEEKQPVQVPVQEQAPQVATLIEKSSGAAQEGGDATLRMAYLGTVRKSLDRSKVNPRSSIRGTVMIRFTVGPNGQVLSRSVQKSSGSKVLDDAAMAAIERAAPFPPMPEKLASGPLEVQVPFNFITR